MSAEVFVEVIEMLKYAQGLVFFSHKNYDVSVCLQTSDWNELK